MTETFYKIILYSSSHLKSLCYLTLYGMCKSLRRCRSCRFELIKKDSNMSLLLVETLHLQITVVLSIV